MGGMDNSPYKWQPELSCCGIIQIHTHAYGNHIVTLEGRDVHVQELRLPTACYIWVLPDSAAVQKHRVHLCPVCARV